MPDRQFLAEATASLGNIQQTQAQATKGRFRVLLIKAGWGSSGYYSEALLRRDGPTAWPAGTQNYLNHPTVTETIERPERAVEDWASVLVTDPVWDPVEKGLVAEVEVFPQWRWLLNEEFLKQVGLSIRAEGTVEYGEAEGREGPLVTSLAEGISVDWVTRAGAGGRVLQLIESARLAEGRHSAGPWDEHKHPRAGDGKFGHGAGTHSAGGSRSGGGSDGPGGDSSGGGDSKSGSSKGAKPEVLASSQVKVASGGTLKLDRHADGSLGLDAGRGAVTFDPDDTRALMRALEDADDDWLEVGGSKSIVHRETTADGGVFSTLIGDVSRTGKNAFELKVTDSDPSADELKDLPGLTLTRKDIQSIVKANDRLNDSKRVETGTGPMDISITDDRKVNIRTTGDDEKPAEVTLDAKSMDKVRTALEALYEGFDELETFYKGDAADHVTRVDVPTNAGKIRVERFGGGEGAYKPGERLEMEPAGGGWKITVNGDQYDTWHQAMRDAEEAALAERRLAIRRGWLLSENATLTEAKVSDTPWSGFSQGDYSIEQWRKACLVGPSKASEDKANYSLPVREPDGTLNRNAVHAAASRIGQLKADTAIKKAAAKKLIGLYGQLDEEPPDSLIKLAGVDSGKPAGAGKSPPPFLKTTKEAMVPAPGPTVGAWLESRVHLACTQLTDEMYGSGRLTRDERLSLSSAIGDGLKAFASRVEADQPQLYQRGPYDGPGGETAMSEAARTLMTEAHGMTANDLREALCDAVKETYGGKEIFVWVRDYTDEWVVFSLETQTESALYQQPYAVDEATQAVTLAGEPVEVVARTTYIPEPQAPGEPPEDKPVLNAAPVTENAPGTPPTNEEIKEGEMPELTEAQARELQEARDAAEAARAKADQDAADAASARAELARFKAVEAARPIATALLAESTLPTPAQAKVLATVTAETVPLTDAAALDEAALKTRVTEAITAESTYLASLLEESGAGQVSDLGESATTPGVPAPAAATNPAATTALEETYKARGLSPEAARLAAAGRP